MVLRKHARTTLPASKIVLQHTWFQVWIRRTSHQVCSVETKRRVDTTMRRQRACSTWRNTLRTSTKTKKSMPTSFLIIRPTYSSPFLRAYANIMGLVSKDKKSSGTFFPAFMYKDCRFEPEAMDEGFARHYIIVRVCEKFLRSHVHMP